MLTEVKANVAPTPGMIKPSELKCTSPETFAAMRIARRCGVLTTTMGSPMGGAEIACDARGWETTTSGSNLKTRGEAR